MKPRRGSVGSTFHGDSRRRHQRDRYHSQSPSSLALPGPHGRYAPGGGLNGVDLGFLFAPGLIAGRYTRVVVDAGPPLVRTCPSRASGSSRCGAVPHTSRWLAVIRWWGTVFSMWLRRLVHSVAPPSVPCVHHGSDLPTVPGGSTNPPARDAEDLSWDGTNIQAGLGVPGLPVALVFCVSYLSGGAASNVGIWVGGGIVDI
jgi:hypothetical protein